MKFTFNTTPKMIATAVAVLGAALALAAYSVGASPSGAALPVFVGVCAFLVLLFCATQINLEVQVPSQSDPASLAELRWATSAYRADPKHPLGHMDAKGLVATAGVDMSVEDEIQSKGLTAPRVTPQDIEDEIMSIHFFTAEQGARHQDAVNPLDHGDVPSTLALLTFCVLRLRNGFTVTGESACASPENFDAAIGRRIARENAVQKIWPLLGFRLRDKLAGINDPSKAERVLGEVLSVVQHYLPPDGGTVHEAMDKIIGLVDPWPLSNRPAGA
ncbi:Gp49 family protein [Delftia sp. WSY_4]|uniref:Gp49 family protein n=1 Tax=unclassified Delftia TaxID=2613839 RepID=UPI00370A94E4